ncbi:hypothetical protein Tco_0429264, partial [Tanacetum coccineum]
DVYPQCLLTWRLPPRLTELRAPECPYHFLRIPLRPLAPPTSLPESTPTTLVPILRRTARMAMRVPPTMSPGLSASMAEVAAMSEFAFRKRFRSSYESLPYSSLPNLPLRKRYRGTSELVEDDKDEDDEEDEEIKESLDSNSVSEDAEDEGPTTEDEDPAAGDEGLGMAVESCGSDDESRGLDDEGHSVKRVVLVVGTTVSAPLGLGYKALRHRELALEEDHVYSTFEDGMVYIDVPAYPPPAPPVQTPSLPEWSSGSLPISPSPFIVPSPISSPMILLIVPSPIATPATAETEGFLTELGAQVEMQGGLIHDHAVRLEEISPGLFESDAQGENQELRLQLAEERRARLELAKIVDSMRRGQEPRGDISNRKETDRELSRRVLERVVSRIDLEKFKENNDEV